MDKMEWALESLEYLRKARVAIDDDFRNAMQDAKGYPGSWKDPWHGASRDIISNLYHYSEEFVADLRIPNEMFASPEQFEQGLIAYRAFVQAMADDLDEEQAAYEKKHKIVGAPHIVDVARRQVFHVLGAIDHTLSRKPAPPAAAIDPDKADLDLIATLARRFHESVLALKSHPHGGSIYSVKDEWDCQYLFRSILAAYFPDVREEEWSPVRRRQCVEVVSQTAPGDGGTQICPQVRHDQDQEGARQRLRRLRRKQRSRSADLPRLRSRQPPEEPCRLPVRSVQTTDRPD
nr:hypothetical protein [Brevundimonas aurantiaca]